MIAGQNATRTGECGTSYSVPLFLSSVDFVKKIRYTQYKLFFSKRGKWADEANQLNLSYLCSFSGNYCRKFFDFILL